MRAPDATCAVVIPCYNAEPYLETAVDSVLAQSFQDFQIMIVDDASLDGTKALAHQLAAQDSRITVVELPVNRGRSFARNRGAEVSSGPYLSFLDQDDTYHPEFLRVTASCLAELPALDAIKVFPNISVELHPVQYAAVSNSLATTMLMRRAAFEFVGGWPEAMAFRLHPGGCEDIALLHLFSVCFDTGWVEGKLYNYNHRPGNALDRFLSRSSVIAGELVLAEPVAEDGQVALEVQSLLQLLRARVRETLMHQAGGRFLRLIEME